MSFCLGVFCGFLFAFTGSSFPLVRGVCCFPTSSFGGRYGALLPGRAWSDGGRGQARAWIGGHVEGRQRPDEGRDGGSGRSEGRVAEGIRARASARSAAH